VCDTLVIVKNSQKFYSDVEIQSEVYSFLSLPNRSAFESSALK